jgi:diguanylate cyclase (GGDEF)-like protein
MRDGFYAAIIEGMGDGVIVVALTGELLVVNDAARRILPSTSRPGITLAEWAAADAICTIDGRKLDPAETPFGRALAGEACHQVELRVGGAGTGARVVSVTARPTTTPDGRSCAVALVRDVTQATQRHERDVAQKQAMTAKLWSLMDRMSTGILFEDAAGRIELVNRAFCDMFDIPGPEAILGAAPGDPRRAPRVLDVEGFLDVREQRMQERTEVLADRVDMADGRVLERDYMPVDITGIAQGHFWGFRDVTERERARERLAELSNRDELTGLYNRRGFTTLAEQWLRLAARTRRTPLLLFVDVNGMKPVNDLLGHAAGDRMLRDTADMLRATFRDSDILARLGGDEFVVLAVDAMPEHSTLLCDRLQRKLAHFSETTDRPYRITVSVGVSVWDPLQPRTIHELLAEADARMYEAKRRRRGVSAVRAATAQ